MTEARVSSLRLEALTQNPGPEARVSSLRVEVLQSVDDEVPVTPEPSAAGNRMGGDRAIRKPPR